MNRLPAPSSATPDGNASDPLTAGPPSPDHPLVPLPATVVMVWVAASTRRTRLPDRSAMKRLPAASTATPNGKFREASAAGPLSPVDDAAPLPATSVRMPVTASTLNTRLFAESARYMLSALSTHTAAGATGALTAGPPTPEVPVVPFPATVTMIPFCANRAEVNDKTVTAASVLIGRSIKQRSGPE